MSETESVKISKGELGYQQFPDRKARTAPDRSAGEPNAGSDAEPILGEDSADQNEVKQVPIDVIFDILKNQRRRHVFRYLKEHNTATLSDLAEHVAALENEKDIQSLTSGERKRVYVGLYQCHLPRMDAADFIDFDSDRGEIELNDAAYQLDDYLIDSDSSDREWSRYFLTIAAGGGATYLLSTILFGSGSILSVIVVLGIIGASITCAISSRLALDSE